MSYKSLERILSRYDAFLQEYANIILLLESNGLIDFLQEFGQRYFTEGAKDIGQAALEGARVQGWNECVNLLRNFKEKIVMPNINQSPTLTPDFGGRTAALNKGLLTEQEVEAITSGQPIDYSSIINQKHPDPSIKPK